MMMLIKHSTKLFLLAPLLGFCASLSPIQKLDTASGKLLNPACTYTQSASIAANHLFQQSKFQEAFKANLPLAKCGDPRAKLEIGFMNEFGRGTKQNYAQAALWYYTGIRLNAYNVKPLERGISAYFGINGVKQNMKSATQWFRMAAELSTDRY